MISKRKYFPDPLKKCPFCGGEAEMIGGMSEGEVAWVVCKQCHAESATYPTKEAAKAGWNRRNNEWLIL